ncbi:lipopolysaccharide biosynthesis protein [Arenibacter palladensis]|uniref:lipopolysaccharide biosynthesis protein n=1 Tax=Arenibacter palladensis TaxID=237373 RepID=UPI002FD41A86
MEKTALNQSIVRGFIWNFISLAIHRSFDFIIKLVLARILFPEQFGIVAMAAVFTSFIQVFTNLGFGAAIVQKKESELRDEHFHTAFWSGIVWAIFLYTIVFFIVTPIVSNFYNEPILLSIIPVLSLGILSSPINAIQKAILTRNLEFKKIALINNMAGIFSGILALVLAYLGFGVWALVFNSVATFVVAMPLYFKFTNWKPKSIWDRKAFNDIFGFGVFTTGTNLLGNLAGNLDYLFIGKILSSSLVGAYSLAMMITAQFQTNLITLINQIMYPVFGKLQDDKTSLKKYYATVTMYNSLLVFPFMGFFIVFNETFITVFFGDKWSMAVIPLMLLAVSQLVSTLSSTFPVVLRSIGKPKLEMKIQFIVTFFIDIPLVYFGTHIYGVIGTSIAIIIINIFNLFIAQYYTGKLIDFGYSNLMKSIYKPTLITFTTILFTYLLIPVLNVPFYINFSIYFILYSGLFFLFFKKEMSPIISTIKAMAKK